jgi:8-amino-7-oxononanoate synthase
VCIYPHGDLDALEAMLLASRAETKVVVTDCVFSMDGDLAPLPELLELCERHDAWLIADDAHGFGVLGENGRGALEHFGLRSPNLVYMGTLGKAAGVAGAFVAAHETVIEWLVQRARPYIYTTAAPPALAYALYEAIDLIESDEGRARRTHLQTLIARLGRGLDVKPWRLLPSDTAIQPLIIGPNRETLMVAQALYEQGIWVPAIRPPTVPADTARLRISLSAAHTEADVAQLCEALNRLAQLES